MLKKCKAVAVRQHHVKYRQLKGALSRLYKRPGAALRGVHVRVSGAGEHGSQQVYYRRLVVYE